MVVARTFGKAAAKLAEAVKPFTSKERATDFARLLREQYREGKAAVDAAEAAGSGGGDGAGDDGAGDVADERTVIGALRDIDWAAVRHSTAAKTGDVAERMKAMAAEVDWRSVQPAAAHVSSALIAAAASGRLPLGGPLGSTVARAIMNDRGLAQRVSAAMTARPDQGVEQVPDFRGVIDTTARDQAD